MTSLKTFLPIALSLIIAAGGSFALYKWIQGKQGTGKEIVHVQADASPVIVATGDLAWGTKLKPEMLKTTPYLKESLPEGHFSKLPDITGRVLISPVRANEPITVHKLAPNSIETGGVAAVLKPGKRAIAVKGDKVIGISGFINPGNRVDVLVTIEDPKKKEDKTKTILENILVLATGTQIQENEKGEPAPVDVYTLEVDPEDGEKLALAATEGRVQLALRSTLDTETVLTTGVTIPKMLAAFSYAEKKPKPAANQKSRSAIRRWIPRNTVTVDIIKGTDTSQKKFSQ
jgi:pilus assembly protein CpaB